MYIHVTYRYSYFNQSKAPSAPVCRSMKREMWSISSNTCDAQKPQSWMSWTIWCFSYMLHNHGQLFFNHLWWKIGQVMVMKQCPSFWRVFFSPSGKRWLLGWARWVSQSSKTKVALPHPTQGEPWTSISRGTLDAYFKGNLGRLFQGEPWTSSLKFEGRFLQKLQNKVYISMPWEGKSMPPNPPTISCLFFKENDPNQFRKLPSLGGFHLFYWTSVLRIEEHCRQKARKVPSHLICKTCARP